MNCATTHTWKQFQAEVKVRVSPRPHLKPVFGDLHDISRRIRDVDPALFIVRNAKMGRFEVHSLNHAVDTMAWPVPWSILDGRVLEKALENRIERAQAIFREMDDRNRRLRESAERESDIRARDTGRDMARILSKVG